MAWGQVVVVQADGGVAYLHEKELSAKLELLYSKSLYLVALNLATSEEVTHSCTSSSEHVHPLVMLLTQTSCIMAMHLHNWLSLSIVLSAVKEFCRSNDVVQTRSQDVLAVHLMN